MTLLTEALGKSVYIGGHDVDCFSPIPVFIETILCYFKEKLNKVKVETEETLIAAYGILTSATAIPDSIPEGTEIFLIIPRANTEKDSFIVVIESIYLLQKIIEAMVGATLVNGDGIEDVVDYMVNVEEQNIENLYVVYGHTIDLTYNIESTTLKMLTAELNHPSLKNLMECQA